MKAISEIENDQYSDGINKENNFDNNDFVSNNQIPSSF
jgi:hypothetical protein